MKFRYLREYPDGRDNAVFWGVPFERREVAEVPEGSEAARIFIKHPCFELVSEAVTAPVAIEEPAQAAIPPTKEDLIAIAEANEIKIDKRWSYDRLAQAVISHANKGE